MQKHVPEVHMKDGFPKGILLRDLKGFVKGSTGV